MTMIETEFSKLSDDVVLNIFFKLEDDPRTWSRLACVSTRFSSLIRNVCWKNKCSQAIPSVVSDLLSAAGADPPGGWASLHKLGVCCPGLLHAGVLLEHSDFGLERELGPDENYQEPKLFQLDLLPSSSESGGNSEVNNVSWSLYDDLYFDTVYNASESQDRLELPKESQEGDGGGGGGGGGGGVVKAVADFAVGKRRKTCRSHRSHVASAVWNLNREQGNKLLASRFRGDCLYICDWPGCVHTEEKRNYMLFRGIFKNFKRSRVWRTINDGNRNKIDVKCAFCSCRQTWDLHSAFCLKRVFGFHDDGEPVVRAYVCENGHVSGAWTDWPLYT
ncbi:phytochrome A-associated F-box protein [Cornus florida]|uniref:phytochrome A-associated F-box protein n=1 Tax=Cornus florida TaxID=4283 RepID=UPI00289BAB86|nr:phytochrome A-associated F-box protein [Cornus florida]